MGESRVETGFARVESGGALVGGERRVVVAVVHGELAAQEGSERFLLAGQPQVDRWAGGCRSPATQAERSAGSERHGQQEQHEDTPLHALSQRYHARRPAAKVGWSPAGSAARLPRKASFRTESSVRGAVSGWLSRSIARPREGPPRRRCGREHRARVPLCGSPHAPV